MKFDIVDPKEQARRKKAKKKKSDREFAIMVGLLLLALILLMIYYFTMDNNTTTPAPTGPKVIQQSRLQVVNENSNERPIAIMIDNKVGNSSQAGLQDSYLNYEMLV